jgi:hypothetical protein
LSTRSRAVKASDLSNYGANQGAKIIGADTTGFTYSSATNVNQVLDDLDAAILASNTPGVPFTVGAGGVTKGSLVIISANNTVLPKTSLASAATGIGLAATAEAAAGTVKVVKDSTVLTGVLTGATFGTRYYWDGSAITATQPSGGGAYVYQVGYAKNATDLLVDVNFIKRNS